MLQTVNQLSGQGWQVAPDGTVSVRPGSPLDQYAKISPTNAMKLQQLAATNSVIVKALLASFDTTDRAVSQNLRAAVGGLDSRRRSSASGGPIPRPRRTTPVRRSRREEPGGGEEVVGLQQGQHERLLRDWPEKLGNLDGIPVADRDTPTDHHATGHRPPRRGRQESRRDRRGGLGPPRRVRHGRADDDPLQQRPQGAGGSATGFRQVGRHPDLPAGVSARGIQGRRSRGDRDRQPRCGPEHRRGGPRHRQQRRSGWLGSDDAANLYNEA